jgi:nucleotide sugar dehydrogenase
MSFPEEFSIGIVGNGVVGSAIARTYMEWFRVFVFDKNPKRRVHDLDTVMACDLIFICLPETALDDFIKQVIVKDPVRIQDDANLVLKSTVKIGTTSKMQRRYKLRNMVHSPEFLTERCAFVDSQIPSRNVIGGDNNRCRDLLREIYQFRFPGTALFIMNSPEESEAVKLFSNGFFAVKIAFFNEVEKLAECSGWNWQRILNAVLADGRITRSHTRVPGPDGLYGFGGRCLPKDLNYLIEALGSNAIITEAAKYYARQNRSAAAYNTVTPNTPVKVSDTEEKIEPENLEQPSVEVTDDQSI